MKMTNFYKDSESPAEELKKDRNDNWFGFLIVVLIIGAVVGTLGPVGLIIGLIAVAVMSHYSKPSRLRKVVPVERES